MMKKLKKIAKNLLSIPWIRAIYNKTNRVVLEFAAFNIVTNTFYNIVTFFIFSREQYAVAVGQRNYYRSLNAHSHSRVELRRNIHRLEKALIMRPRRPVFARDYIHETVEFYSQAISQYNTDHRSIDNQELIWAQNVLAEYFKTIELDHNLAAIKANFESHAFKPKESDKVPYKYKDIAKSTIGYQDLLDLAMQRRSVRWFKQQPVARDLIDQALMVARQSPTACNRMPYEFKVFDDPELVKKVANIPFGAAGYANNIPVIIVVVGDLSSYFSPRDRHAIYIDSSLAAMAFMQALTALGLGSSVINWPDFEPLEIKMKKAIGLTANQRPIMLIAVGNPDPEGMVPYSQKKELDTFRTYNNDQ